MSEHDIERHDNEIQNNIENTENTEASTEEAAPAEEIHAEAIPAAESSFESIEVAPAEEIPVPEVSFESPVQGVFEAETAVQPEPQPQPMPEPQRAPTYTPPQAPANSYTAQPQQQNGYYRQQPPYQAPYQQPSQGYYRPQTNEYVYAPQAPKKKSNAGKAAFAIIISLLSIFVISVASISGYMYYQRMNNPSPPFRPGASDVPMDEHEFRHDDDSEEVDDPEGTPAGNNVDNINRDPEKIRDFPTLEQLAAPDDAMSIPDIYDKVIPSVVGVSCYVQGGTQTGTGFVISDDGYIVTNAHVIEDYISVMIVDGDMNEFEAEVIGSDSQTDIAVLKIDPSGKDLVAVEFGKSGDLRIGELAIAIGNPLGFDLYGTMTTGIISGLDRSVTIGDNTMNLMQTSASINRGNSGGPLIDAYGRVIGITSAKIDSTYGESLGFAIPIDEALPIVRNLIEYGYVIGRPSIGISGRDITEILSFYLRVPQGVKVYTVTEGSGADRAGIQPEDIIIGIQGETITSMNELNAIKNQYSVGDTITLTIYRPITTEWGHLDGKSFDVEVVLTEATPAPQ